MRNNKSSLPETIAANSLTGQTLHNSREEEGSGVMPICELFCCSEECSSNQSATRSFKICNVNTEAHAHQSDHRSSQLLHNIHKAYILFAIQAFNT